MWILFPDIWVVDENAFCAFFGTLPWCLHNDLVGSNGARWEVPGKCYEQKSL